ncbi:hypothetical protein EV122DRAFT_278305 [Schizophyllum commune]
MVCLKFPWKSNNGIEAQVDVTNGTIEKRSAEVLLPANARKAAKAADAARVARRAAKKAAKKGVPAAPNADANAAKAARLEKRKARMAMGGKMEGKERVRVRKERDPAGGKPAKRSGKAKYNKAGSGTGKSSGKDKKRARAAAGKK